MNSKRRSCPNCGGHVADGAESKCSHCGYLTEAPSAVWWRYFWISVVATPALSLGIPFWLRFMRNRLPKEFTSLLFLTAEVLVLLGGSAVSAYLLARSRKEPSHSANIPAYL